MPQDEVGVEPKKRFCEKHPGWQLRNVQDNPDGRDMPEDFRCPMCLRLAADKLRDALIVANEEVAEHNREYHHVTSVEKFQQMRSALAKYAETKTS